MKKLIILLLALFCMALLVGCACEHEWTEADCVTPKTCSLCEETEGAPLGHSWLAATCLEAKTCEVCNVTEGEALGHSWTEATCTDPKTCANCSLTEGEALGHIWLEATTEVPQTCETCAATEGERIITDPRFTTAACSPVFGKWSAEVTVPPTVFAEEIQSYLSDLRCVYTLEFSNDGTIIETVQIANEAQFRDMLSLFVTDLFYEEFTAQGMTKDEADAAILQTYGISLEDLVAIQVADIDISTMFDNTNFEYAYYIDGDQLYMGLSWADELEPQTFTLEGDTLHLTLGDLGPVEFTRVTE